MILTKNQEVLNIEVISISYKYQFKRRKEKGYNIPIFHFLIFVDIPENVFFSNFKFNNSLLAVYNFPFANPLYIFYLFCKAR